MTAPDGSLPEGAYSGGGGQRGIVSLAAITEESAKLASRSAVYQPYAQVNLNLGDVVNAGVNEFTADLADAVTGATGGLIDLSAWAAALRADAERALTDAVSARQTAQGAQAIAENQTAIIQSTNSNVQVVLDGLPVKPYWESMNLTEEASFPRNALHRACWDLRTTQAAGYTQVDQLFAKLAPTYVPPVNILEGAFIRCLYSGSRKTVTYVPDAVATPCELYVVLGRMTENGDITVVWVSPNQTPLITASRFERTVELPNEVVFEQGETAFVGIHQRGSGNARPLLGLEAVDIPRPATVWPPQLNAQFSTSALLSPGLTLAAGALSFASRTIPYVSLGRADLTGDPIKLMFYEDFDSGVLPTALVRMSAQAATVSNGVFVVSGGNDGIRRYLYAQPLNYDDQRVTGQIRNPTGRVARLMLRSSANNAGYAALTVFSNRIVIDRASGSGETFTALASLDIAVADGDELRFSAIGNVYSVDRRSGADWIQILSHTDTAGAIPAGPGHRYVGLGNERGFFSNGGGWDYWKAEDL